MPIFYRIAAVLLALAASPALALTLPPMPEGSCGLNTEQEADRNALALLHLSTQQPAELRALFTDCGDLDALRQGRLPFLTRYGAVFEQHESVPEGATRATTITLLAQGLGISAATATESLRAAQLAAGAKRERFRDEKGSDSLHRILGRSPDYLLLGSEQRHLGHRSQYMVAVITGITVIDGKIVTANFFLPMQDAASFDSLLPVAESYMRRLLAENP